MRKIIYGILYSRWEPVETVLAIHQAAVGLWLIFPYWEAYTGRVGVAGVSRTWELFLGVTGLALGVAHITFLAMSRVMTGWRARTLFLMFINYFLTSMLALQVSGGRGIRWTAFLTLAFLTGISYLSVAVGEANE